LALREVLFLIYHFPPLGMGGVQRPLKFVKYLPIWGWRPLVLTVKPIRYYALDATLLREVPPEAKVFRTESLDFLRLSAFYPPNATQRFSRIRRRAKPFTDWVMIPDLSLGWLPFAVSMGLSIIRSRPIEAILATAPPYTTHLVGGLLARFTGLPLVLDYRDAWTFDSPRPFPTSFHRALNHFLERKSLISASRILAVNRTIARGLQTFFPPSKQDRVQTLPLGYDPEDFDDVTISEVSKFRITHVGTLIGERSPKPLLSALKCLFEERPELCQKIEVRFVGLTRPEDQRIICDSGLGDVVTCIPYLPHAESISELLSAHALYLTIGAGEGETISTGKLYEYLGARKPIIASAPSCEAAWTIEETKSGRVFHPEDNEGLAQEILRLYTLHKDGRLNGPSLEAVQRYDRQRLARELARHLSEVA